mmetsp:Transcript_6026/g.8877  ORF Transcript_6026/g.8877 Transcript_6026/m.8877 type:complete len:871 (+) Transcript_6026:100-2712(+)
MAEEESVLRKKLGLIVLYLSLEDVARLSRIDKGLSGELGELGAGGQSQVRVATRYRRIHAKYRTRYWASAQGVDEARKAMLRRQKIASTSVAGYFERCAKLFSGGRGGLDRLSTKGIEGEIRRDVGRTFATRSFFRSRFGQDALADVLLALSVAHPQIGYCQGMNLVVGALLEVHLCDGHIPVEDADTGGSRQSHNKEEVSENQVKKENTFSPMTTRSAQRSVFWLASALCSVGEDTDETAGFVRKHRLLDNALELRELWRPGMPQLKLRVYQFDRLLTKYLPKLRRHFRRIGMAPDILASQWFFTLLAYAIPADWLPRVWDVVFADGWKALMRLALARLALAQDELLAASLEDASQYFRDRRSLVRLCSHGSDLVDPVEIFLATGFKFKVTRTELAQLTEQFGLLLLEERCNLGSVDIFGGNDSSMGGSSCSSSIDEDDTDVDTNLGGRDNDKNNWNDDAWLQRYGGKGNDLLADAPARALRARLAELDETARRDAATLRSRVERVDREAADARIRLEKATQLLRDRRRLVGQLVDEKRRAAAEAARLFSRACEEEEDETDEYIIDRPASPYDEDDDMSSLDSTPKRSASPGSHRHHTSPSKPPRQRRTRSATMSSTKKKNMSLLQLSYQSSPSRRPVLEPRLGTANTRPLSPTTAYLPGFLFAGSAATRRGFRPLASAASCFTTAARGAQRSHPAVLRDDLNKAQTRAAKAEIQLRSARNRLHAAAHDFVLAQADLDDATERKRTVEAQLLHVLDTATATRRTIFTDVVAGADTPDLRLVRRFSENHKKNASPAKPYQATVAKIFQDHQSSHHQSFEDSLRGASGDALGPDVLGPAAPTTSSRLNSNFASNNAPLQRLSPRRTRSSAI